MYQPTLDRRNLVAQRITESCGGTFNAPVQQDDNLQKGEILDNLKGYGDNALKFNKKGSWIKEQMPKIIAKLTVLKNELEAKLVALKAVIGDEPTEIRTSYQLPTVSVNVYPYEKCHSGAQIGGSYCSSEPDEATINMRNYNSLANSLLNVVEDLGGCSTIAEAVEADKSYTLSVSQLFCLLAGTDAMQKGNADELQKAEDDDADDTLEKGGEGSKGGKIIGHTKTGKPIYEHSVANYLKTFHKQLDSGSKALPHSTAHEAHITKNQFGGLSLEMKHKEKGHTSLSVGIDKDSDLYKEHADEVKGDGKPDVKSRITNAFSALSAAGKDSKAYSSAVKHGYEPEDDGESESTFIDNVSKHENAHKIAAEMEKHAGKLKSKTSPKNEADKFDEDEYDKRMKRMNKGEEDDLEKGEGEGSRGGKIVGHTAKGTPIYAAQNFKNTKPTKTAHSDTDFQPGHVVKSAGGTHVVSAVNGGKVTVKDNYGEAVVDKKELTHTGEKYNMDEYNKFHENMYRSKKQVDGLPDSRIEQTKNGKYNAVYNTILHGKNGEFDNADDAEKHLESHHEQVKKNIGVKSASGSWKDMSISKFDKK